MGQDWNSYFKEWFNRKCWQQLRWQKFHSVCYWFQQPQIRSCRHFRMLRQQRQVGLECRSHQQRARYVNKSVGAGQDPGVFEQPLPGLPGQVDNAIRMLNSWWHCGVRQLDSEGKQSTAGQHWPNSRQQSNRLVPRSPKKLQSKELFVCTNPRALQSHRYFSR